MRIIFYIFLILIVILGVTFAALNAELVPFHYYIGKKELPLSFLLAFSFTLGIMLGWFLTLSMVFRVKRKNFELKSHVKKLQQKNIS